MPLRLAMDATAFAVLLCLAGVGVGTLVSLVMVSQLGEENELYSTVKAGYIFMERKKKANLGLQRFCYSGIY